MNFTDFIPYYSDLRLAGLLACAYAAAVSGLVLMLLAARIFKLNFGFERAACFCLVASGILWMLPALPFVEKQYSNIELLAVLCAFLPLMRFVYQIDWKAISILWLSYALAQVSLYFYLIN